MIFRLQSIERKRFAPRFPYNGGLFVMKSDLSDYEYLCPSFRITTCSATRSTAGDCSGVAVIAVKTTLLIYLLTS